MPIILGGIQAMLYHPSKLGGGGPPHPPENCAYAPYRFNITKKKYKWLKMRGTGDLQDLEIKVISSDYLIRDESVMKEPR